MLGPLNARTQAIVPSFRICGRSCLLSTLVKRISRAGNGPKIVRGALVAPKDAPRDAFYNRVTELDFLKKKLNEEVGVITVLVGPRNCGKSRLLEKLAEQYEEEEMGPLFLQIDGRFTPVQTPDDVAKALTKALEPGKLQRLSTYISSTLSLLPAISINAGLFTISLELLLPKIFGAKLAPTINRFDKILNALEPLSQKPVIVIDEANLLMNWEEKGPLQPELKRLLEFLIGISKQNRLAHVLLATSDDFLASWLVEAGMTHDKFQVKVLGDLTEEEAHKFVYGDGVTGGWLGKIDSSSGTQEVPDGAEKQWPAIYERCGGNIGLLGECVKAARVEGNWDDALETVVAGAVGAIERGFNPETCIMKGEAPLWTRDQWKMVLVRITTAPYHAVLASELVEQFGQGGVQILLSMVKYNLLALRPYSTLPRDLPREVYENKEGAKSTVVTLPLPAHVWAAKTFFAQQ